MSRGNRGSVLDLAVRRRKIISFGIDLPPVEDFYFTLAGFYVTGQTRRRLPITNAPIAAVSASANHLLA
jgi:hypothetical protein